MCSAYMLMGKGTHPRFTDPRGEGATRMAPRPCGAPHCRWRRAVPDRSRRGPQRIRPCRDGPPPGGVCVRSCLPSTSGRCIRTGRSGIRGHAPPVRWTSTSAVVWGRRRMGGDRPPIERITATTPPIRWGSVTGITQPTERVQTEPCAHAGKHTCGTSRPGPRCPLRT